MKTPSRLGSRSWPTDRLPPQKGTHVDPASNWGDQRLLELIIAMAASLEIDGPGACHAQFSRLGFKKRRFRDVFVSWNLLKFDGFVQLLEKVRVLGALKHLSAKLALQRGLSTAPCRNPRSLDGSALKEKLHG